MTTVTRILDAALSTLAELNSVHAMRISWVAASARVSRGTIAYYFPKKRDLIAACSERWVRNLWHFLDQKFPSERLCFSDAELETLAQHLVQDAVGSPALFRYALEVAREVRVDARRQVHPLLQWIDRRPHLFPEPKRARLLAFAFLAVVELELPNQRAQSEPILAQVGTSLLAQAVRTPPEQFFERSG